MMRTQPRTPGLPAPPALLLVGG